MKAGNLAAQAFGGLIEAGVLGDMDGKRGIRAWGWLFIIEGVLTIFLPWWLFPFFQTIWWVWLLERKLMHWYSIYNCWYAVPLAYASLVALVVG
jgi:hypothetical protein